MISTGISCVCVCVLQRNTHRYIDIHIYIYICVSQHTLTHACTVQYGGEEHLAAPPKELLLGQTEHYVQYSQSGRIMLGQERAVVRSKYTEDRFPGNHTVRLRVRVCVCVCACVCACTCVRVRIYKYRYTCYAVRGCRYVYHRDAPTGTLLHTPSDPVCQSV